MGFLSKKSMLVSLLAVSLAAYASGSASVTGHTTHLPCGGGQIKDKIDKKKDLILTFERVGTCNLTEVTFTTNAGAFTWQSATTSTVVYKYNGSDLATGAEFTYKTVNSTAIMGSGGGIIHNN